MFWCVCVFHKKEKELKIERTKHGQGHAIKRQYFGAHSNDVVSELSMISSSHHYHFTIFVCHINLHITNKLHYITNS